MRSRFNNRRSARSGLPPSFRQGPLPQGARVVQIATVEVCKDNEMIEIKKSDLAILKSHQRLFPHFTQQAVDVKAADAKRIGQLVL